MFYAFVWIALSVLVGMMGTNKSLGFVGCFLISIVLSPLIGFIVAIASSDKVAETVVQPTPQPVQQKEPVPVKMEVVKTTEERLADLQNLKDKGWIKDDEFEKQRERILSGI